MIETGLRKLLLTSPAITNIVGQRIYTEVADQNAVLPYIVLTKISSDFLNTLDGATGMEFKDFDFDCYGKTDVQSRTLANTVKTFIRNYTGPAGLDDTVEAVLLNGESDEHIPPQDGKSVGTFLTTLDFQIQYTPD